MPSLALRGKRCGYGDLKGRRCDRGVDAAVLADGSAGDSADRQGGMQGCNGHAGFARCRSCARRSRPLSRGGDGKRSEAR